MGNVVKVMVFKYVDDRVVTSFDVECIGSESLIEERLILSSDEVDFSNKVRKLQLNCKDSRILIVIQKLGD